PTPTLVPDQPTPTYAPYLLHTVKRGDTLSTIAEKYNVSMADIRWANDIPSDSTTLQVEQLLQIPQYTPTPEAQQPTMVAGTPAQRAGYASPTLLYPPAGMTFTGAQTLVMLQWTSTGILEEEEYYRVELITPTGDKSASTYTYLRSTAWRVPEELFPAPEIANRTCSWRVAIVRRSGPVAKLVDTVISPAAEKRTFFWKPAHQ
ncbi:MAG: LysM peptidoglycan-binding domain-containing protein, partial [Anaerolineae bacterium]|nr:LysM peptidoglycan-binding domain-containing protein [Anaerolineae bacterium]